MIINRNNISQSQTRVFEFSARCCIKFETLCGKMYTIIKRVKTNGCKQHLKHFINTFIQIKCKTFKWFRKHYKRIAQSVKWFWKNYKRYKPTIQFVWPRNHILSNIHVSFEITHSLDLGIKLEKQGNVFNRYMYLRKATFI